MLSKEAPPIEGLAGGQQPMPRQQRRIKCFFAFLGFAGLQAVKFPRDAVALFEQVPGGQQASLFGEEQEHHAHHHRHSRLVGLVGVGGQRIGLATSAGFGARIRRTIGSAVRRRGAPARRVLR